MTDGDHTCGTVISKRKKCDQVSLLYTCSIVTTLKGQSRRVLQHHSFVTKIIAILKYTLLKNL